MDGVAWCARRMRGSWVACRGGFGTNSVAAAGMGSLSSSTVDCSVGGREDLDAVKLERPCTEMDSIERCA